MTDIVQVRLDEAAENSALSAGCDRPVPALSSTETPDDSGLEPPASKNFAATRNACKLCTPLGACLAFRGIQGCVPFLHGSQGCATYIRRYLISHFREPMDIASSNFHEESAVFGGKSNFNQGADNVIRQYEPQAIGLATTCLAETIGEDMPRMVDEFQHAHAATRFTPIVPVSTPSYRGTHVDGFHAAVRALIEYFAKPEPAGHTLNLFPGLVSCADLRHLKDIFQDFGLPLVLVPDYSETMDGESWEDYQKLPRGGISTADVAATGASRASIEFGLTLPETTAGSVLASRCQVPRHNLGLPIGLRASDAFFGLLAALSGRAVPARYTSERGRLVDTLVDGHKYVFEKRAVVYGEEDLVIGLTAFLCEIGVTPVLCASGGRSGRFARELRAAAPGLPADTAIHEGCDFARMEDLAAGLKPDFLLGSSKGYSLARKLGRPLIRVGFPVHDRLGGHRILHLGYHGALGLYERIANTLIEMKQTSSPVGYSYL